MGQSNRDVKSRMVQYIDVTFSSLFVCASTDSATICERSDPRNMTNNGSDNIYTQYINKVAVVPLWLCLLYMVMIAWFPFY
jgi:hypothetical protein